MPCQSYHKQFKDCQEAEGRLSFFFKQYSIGILLAKCGAIKQKGISMVSIFQYLVY